jgi:8-oxo-dGTP pyrophosphatase MutT (NUDIX family)
MDSARGSPFARPGLRAHDVRVMRLPDRLARHLAGRPRLTIHDPDAIACAVLVPLAPLPGEDDYDVIYTLRSEHLPNHKGQVAFPGGKRTRQEDLVRTALRESAEEIGIAPGDVQVLGCLDDVTTMAGQYVITPWVGLIPPAYPFRPNPSEVADVFSVPLSRLVDKQHHGSSNRRWGGNDYDVPVITAGRHEIWGATHQITVHFLELLALLEAPGKAPRDGLARRESSAA